MSNFFFKERWSFSFIPRTVLSLVQEMPRDVRLLVASLFFLRFVRYLFRHLFKTPEIVDMEISY